MAYGAAPGAANYDSDVLKQKARDLITKCMDEARTNNPRLDRDKQDWLNLLYYRGGVDNQWVVWNKSDNAWVPRPYEGDEAALPDYVPRACTNVFATKIDGIIALLDQSAPTQEWRPVTDDDEDIASADVIQNAMPALYDEIDYTALRRQMHKQIALTDKVALHVYYDPDAGDAQIIPAQQCPACGALHAPMELDETDNACPSCGATDVVWQQAPTQPNGMPPGREYQTGRMCARIHPSFEFSLPRAARQSDERTVPWVLLHSRYGEEDAVRCWPQAKAVIEGARGDSGKTGTQRQYADAMMRLASPGSAKIQGTTGNAETIGPVVYQLQHDPTPDFPDGLYAVLINDELVETGPLVKDIDGKAHKTILIRTWANAPGSAFNKPPADDLTSLQYWRNLIESLIALSLLHNAAPRTWTPTSVILEDQLTGRPGENIRFRSTIPGERPITEQGHNPADGLYRYLELIDTKFEEVSKLNSVLMGTRPAGDPTLGEVQILQERGMASFKTPLDTLVDFEKRLSRMLLTIARQSAWSPRFRAIQGENGQWDVAQFAFTDLKGRVDVTCEPSTAWPKSQLMENLKVKEAVGMGAIVPQMDPELSGKLLTKLGLAEFKPSIDVVRKQIARQLDRWKAATMPQQVMDATDPAAQPAPWWGVQALTLHLMLKSQFLMTEEVEQLARLNQPVYQAMVMHVQSLQQLVQMLTAPPPEAAPAGDDKDKGPDGSALHGAIQSGALTPASAAQAAPDPMQAAMASGALIPAGAQSAQDEMQRPSIDQLIQAHVLLPVLPSANGTGAGPVQ